tara:strand:+ start:996 stop:1964 length:969 start_codon:yes stop_codon:yes gene_type:complete
MKKPLISIIIPTFNRASLLPIAMDSVLRQTYQYWECIIVDDGSTDATVAVAKGYAVQDFRFKVLRRPQHKSKGANTCRNLGLEQSRGKYINFLDSDDYFLPSKLEEQVIILEQSNSSVCICQTNWYDSSTNKFIGLRSKKLLSDNTLEEYINTKIFWYTGAPLWRRNALILKQLKFDENLHQSQEYDFHVNAIAKLKLISVIENVLCVMVKHSSNLSISDIDSKIKVYSNLRAREKILQKHSYRLDTDTLKNVHYYMHDMYCRLLLNGQYEKAGIALKFILRNRSSSLAKLIRSRGYLCKIIIAFPVYLLFKKGYFLLKFTY